MDADDLMLASMREAIDLGHKMCLPSLASPPVSEKAANTELRELALERLAEARSKLRDAMKAIDGLDDPSAHYCIAELVGNLDWRIELLEDRWDG